MNSSFITAPIIDALLEEHHGVQICVGKKKGMEIENADPHRRFQISDFRFQIQMSYFKSQIVRTPTNPKSKIQNAIGSATPSVS